MEPLWKIRSGKFAGWRDGQELYDENGHHVGYFNGDTVYSHRGVCIGELFNADTIGKRTGVLHPRCGVRGRYASRALSRYADRAGAPIAGWDDPEF